MPLWIFGRKKAKQSARQKIEATRRIFKKEMAWYKTTAGTLIPAAKKRMKERVSRKDPPWNARSFVHSHPDSARFSITDLRMFLQDVVKTKMKTWHIASVNKKRKVKGYAHIFATKQLFQAPLKQIREFTEKVRFDEAYLSHFIDDRELAQERIDELVQQGWIKIRRTTMPGYTYDPQLGDFIEKKAA